MVVLCQLFTLAAQAQLAWKDLGEGRLQLLDAGKPALVYLYGPQLPAGAPEDRRRMSYIHPLYTPAGVAVTDDFPKDHYHHRGVFWSWPQVLLDGKRLDLWMMRGGIANRFEKWLETKDGRAGAALGVMNGWYVGDRRLVEEEVHLTVKPAAQGRRELELDLKFTAVDKELTLVGAPEAGKGYGGLNVRFAPREKTLIRTSEGEIKKDEDLNPHAWVEYDAVYSGKRAVMRVTPDPSNPGEPNPWCLRFYGFMGPSFPARTPYKLEPGKPLRLKFKVAVADVE